MSSESPDMQVAAPRVLQVLAHDVVGGTELLVVALADGLRERGFDSEVATLDSPGPVACQLGERGVRVHSLGGSAVGRPGAAVRLRSLIRKGGYDLVEAYGFKASLAARLVSRSARPRPVQVCGVMGAHITEVVELDELKGRFALRVERLTSGLVDGYDVIALYAIELLAGIGIPRERLHYIPNGVDLEVWTRRSGEPAAALILCSARFVPRKRQDDLLRAAAELKRRGVPFRLEFAGVGPTQPAVRRLTGELGLGDEVDFLGALSSEELRGRLAEAAVLCLPSLWEGIPAAALEAMAVGVPVVSTDAPGTRDVIDDGTTGLLASPKDPAGLADRLELVLSDPARARSLADAARLEVEREYSLNAMVTRKQALYEELIRPSGYPAATNWAVRVFSP
jgi:glycosyltransferase involved in cell wall biosynthesis